MEIERSHETLVVRSGCAAAAPEKLVDRVFNAFSKMPYRRREGMTFDELWRLNLDRDRAGADSVDKAEAVGVLAVLGENPNELLLTAEDCVFLLEVGIRP